VIGLLVAQAVWLSAHREKQQMPDPVYHQPDTEVPDFSVASPIELSRKTEGELRSVTEEAEIANRVRSDFLSILSHEFRTPLQAIFGYTEVLESEIHGPLNEAQHRDLERIRQSQQHLLNLIDSILESSAASR
jgi:signal transduction histidine kinase